MWNSPRQILQLRLSVLDTDRPIERVIALDADTRLESLHGLIQRAFAWSGDDRHVFTDRRLTERRPEWAAGAWGSERTQKVWEMEHGCRDGEHISMCEWTSTVGQALSANADSPDEPQLYYEYAARDTRQAHEYNACGLLPFDLCNGHWEHGWTVAIRVLDRRKPGRSEEFPALLDGCGRSPLLEAGGAAGDAALNALLDTPQHPRHAELDEWVRSLEGPWASHNGRAFNPNRFDLGAAEYVFSSRRDTYDYRPSKRRAAVGGVELSAYAADAAWAVPPRQRIDVLSAAAQLLLAQPVSVDADAMQRLVGPLDALLRRVATPDAANRPVAETGVSDIFARSLRLVVRRSGAFHLTKAGERAMGDTSALLDACIDGYWRTIGDGAVCLYVLLGMVQGLAGTDLHTQVTAAVTADQNERRRGINDWVGVMNNYGYSAYGARGTSDGTAVDSCIAYLARFGAFATNDHCTRVTPDGSAFARALLTR